MLIIKLKNNKLSSNTYLLFQEKEKKAWLIDPGDSSQIIKCLETQNKILTGIFITHSHFDHIYGINELQAKFIGISVYASYYAKEGMMSDKLNGSYYTDMPFVINGKDISIIKEGDKIPLWENIELKVFETPGHDRDCLSFQLGKNLFTGDALIPGIKVFTKLKYSNKTQASNSINNIMKRFDDDIMIWPGHKDNCFLGCIKPIYTNY